MRISQDEALSYGDHLDVLVAFNWADFALFREELVLAPGVLVIYDAKDGTRPRRSRSTRPSSRSSSRFRSTTSPTRPPDRRFRRTSCSSACSSLLDLPTEGIAGAVDRKFQRKSEEVRAANRKALDAGRAYVLRELEEAPVPLGFIHERVSPSSS